MGIDIPISIFFEGLVSVGGLAILGLFCNIQPQPSMLPSAILYTPLDEPRGHGGGIPAAR